MAAEQPKVCLFCKHYELYMPTCGYSEYTPGSDFNMDCMRNKWRFCPKDSSEEDYYKTITTAEHCEEYQFDERLLKHG